MSRAIYVAKYDPMGKLAWAKRSGGPGIDGGRSVAVLADGSFYVLADFSEQATFGSIRLQAAGGQDVVLIKHDVDGEVIWATSAGGPMDESPLSIATIADGTAYVSGSFVGSSNVWRDDAHFSRWGRSVSRQVRRRRQDRMGTTGGRRDE